MRLIGRMWNKRNELDFSSRSKVLLTLLFALLTALMLAVLMLLIRHQSVSSCFANILNYFGLFFATSVFIFVVMLVLSFLFRSVFAGGCVTVVIMLLIALTNHFKLEITSQPLLLSEFALLFQVRDIADMASDSIIFSWRDIFSIVVSAFWLCVLFVFSKPLRMKWKPSLISAASSAGVFVLVFVIFVNTLILVPLNVGVKEAISAPQTERLCGITFSLLRSAFAGSGLKYPGEYTEEEMLSVLAAVEEYAADEDSQDEDAVQPNIILMLSESFFDIASLENVEFESDPLEIFRSLCEQSVSGSFYAPTVGYGTSNIELSILTGINADLLADGEYLSNWGGKLFEYLPTIPQMLSDAGYIIASMHTFNDTIYLRKNFFPSVGFQEMYFSGDFAAIDEEAAAAENYYLFLDEKISGDFYSDDYLSDVMIKYYEQKTDEAPLFIYGLTMENHSPYSETRNGGGFEFTTAADISDEARTMIANVAQGIYNSSAALEKLIEYFSQVDEPTVIVFFGDHRPGMGISGEETVYCQLGAVPEDVADWTLEDTLQMYSTSYLIWANDDSLLPAERGTVQGSSAGVLGLPILDAAGIEKPLFWRFLESVSSETMFFSKLYYVNADGSAGENLDLEADTKQSDELMLMKKVLYDTFYGKQYITARLGE